MEDLSLEQFEWFAREHDNLRAALDWWHVQEFAEPELRLVNACSELWDRGGYWTEGRQRFEAALGRAGDAPAEVRAGAERRLSDLVARQGDYALGKELAQSAIRLYEASGRCRTSSVTLTSRWRSTSTSSGTWRELARSMARPAPVRTSAHSRRSSATSETWLSTSTITPPLAPSSKRLSSPIAAARISLIWPTT